MKSLWLGMAGFAMIVAAVAVHGGPVGEYADIAADVVAIAGDVHGVLVDVAADKGVHDAAHSLVAAWGDVREAAGQLRHGGASALPGAVSLLAKAGEAVGAAYEALHGDPDLTDAVARLQDIAVRLVDIVAHLKGGGVSGSPPDMTDLAKHAQEVFDGIDGFASCFATGEPYGPSKCGDKDWLGQTAKAYGAWTDSALTVIRNSGGATLTLGESCQSRCEHECHGAHKAACIVACGSGCAPHVCGNCT